VAIGMGALILVMAGFGVNAFYQRDLAAVTPTHDTIPPASKPSPAVPVAPPVAGGAALTLPDSVPADAVAATTARTGGRPAARKPPPRTSARVLRVIGPADATINVDGSVVGRGTWHSENIASGVHHVLVSLNAPAACTAAQDARDVRVAESGTTTIQLAPRKCGTFALDAAPAGARFTVSSGGHEVASGAVPRSGQLLLGEGTYALHVAAKYCADYSGSVTISAGETSRERVRLICQ
jgi:hypothetical protein